jgi:hypothetical protein
VRRYDILSESHNETNIRIPNILLKNQKSILNFKECKALSHPSNNSIFLLDGAQIYLYDNQNEILLQKPSFPLIEHIKRQAICYNEGYIYLIGGFDTITQKSVKTCCRYNIVTEKWQQLSPILFDKMDSSACPINEY